MPDRSNTNFADVHQFHTHFGLPAPQLPVLLDEDVFTYRLNFMQEELEEFENGHNEKDLAVMADSLIDLVYVAMGTAVMMGIPWQLLWDEVQRKNMSKQRVDADTMEGSVRKHRFDIIKPKGWTPPDIEGLLKRFVERREAATQGLVEDPYQKIADEKGITRMAAKNEVFKEIYGGGEGPESGEEFGNSADLVDN